MAEYYKLEATGPIMIQMEHISHEFAGEVERRYEELFGVKVKGGVR